MAPKKKIDVNARIAERLKEKRLQRGMSLDTLAKRLKISLQMAYKYETGRVGFSIERLTDLATVLRVSVSYFLRGEL